MTRHQIGIMIYYGKPLFTWVRRHFGRRWYMAHKDWSVYQEVLGRHFRGQTRDGQVFVYCPVSLLVSWSRGDYEHEWCHACHLFFSAKVESLLDPGEEYKAAR